MPTLAKGRKRKREVTVATVSASLGQEWCTKSGVGGDSDGGAGAKELRA
jgi:hypothetical protein